MFSVAVAVLPLGVTVAEGVKLQVANSGSVPQDKVIALVNEPCGVSVSVNVPGCPAFMLILGGVEVRVKSLSWKL
jgi:invasion protein IalB